MNRSSVACCKTGDSHMCKKSLFFSLPSYFSLPHGHLTLLRGWPLRFWYRPGLYTRAIFFARHLVRVMLESVAHFWVSELSSRHWRSQQSFCRLWSLPRSSGPQVVLVSSSFSKKLVHFCTFSHSNCNELSGQVAHSDTRILSKERGSSFI
jgi:hypothetical protein